MVRGPSRGLVLAFVSLAAAAALVWLTDPLGWADDGALRAALVQRGRVAVAPGLDTQSLAARGTTMLQLDAAPTVARALGGDDAGALRAEMEASNVDALLLPTTAPGEGEALGDRFARFQSVEGFRALHLSPGAALYAPNPAAALSEAHRTAIARVARGLLSGARPPRITSFPEPLRRLRPVEVMVMLKQGPRPRLWRSARGNSIARALNTAAVVARKRWFEREAAMGGPIDEKLPRMRVEVALLSDDGTVGSSDAPFVDRVFSKEHGVAYERKGAWRYLLPGPTAEAGKGRASVAYRTLLEDNGLAPDVLDAPELRLYRLRVDTIAISEPQPAPRDGLGDVDAPGEVLGE